MNAFGEALNLGFMRGSGGFSSYSRSMDSRLRLHSHEFKSLFSAYGLNLRLHSHEFKSLFSAYGLNLRLHSHEFKSLFEVNESQTAFP